MQELASKIIKHRKSIIVAVAIITATLGYQIKHIQVDSDVINSLPDDDPYALALKEIGERFGGNRIGMVILEAETIYTTDLLEHVQQITDSLKLLEGVSSVTSLTNIIDIKGGELGMDVGSLVDIYDLPNTEEEFARLRERIEAKDLYQGTIVSEDGTVTVILFTLYDSASVEIVSSRVKHLVNQLDLPEKVYFAGGPMLVTSIRELIADDMKKLIPVTFIVIAIILFLSFRSVAGVMLPLVVSGISIVWTIGLMPLFGYKMSMISSNLPILLVAVGSAYSIHVVSKLIGQEPSPMRDGLGYLFIPVSLAALTTGIGFLSFIFGAYLDMIKAYGLFTAIGTLFSCVLSLTFVPACLSYAKAANYNKVGHLSKRLEWLLIRIHLLATNHAKRVLLVWLLLILASFTGIFFIKREVDIRDYFQEENSIRKAEDLMIKKMGGTKPVFVHFKGNVQSPELLNLVIKTEEYMKQSPDILNTQSVAGLILDLNEALGQERSIPNDEAMIQQLWFLLDGNEYMSRFVSEDLDEAIIISKFISPDNQSKIQFAEYMRTFIDDYTTDNCEITVTGMPFVDITMDRSLINSQIGSLAIAIVFVIIIVALILGSFRLGLLAAVPIIGAIMILFGIMGIAEIPLNIGTVLVASVALGIGIDYSIHVINYFKKAVADYALERSLKETIMNSGRPIIINVVSVAMGFLVLAYSEMVPLQYFGILVAVSMVGSGLGALTLLPSIILLSKAKKEENKV